MGFDSVYSLRWLAERLRERDLDTPESPRRSLYAAEAILGPAIREILAYREGRPLPPMDDGRCPYIADARCPGCGLDLRDSALMGGRNFVTVDDGRLSERFPLTYYDGVPRLWNSDRFDELDWRDTVVRCDCGASLAIWDGKEELP